MPIPFIIGGAIAIGSLIAANRLGKKKGDKVGYARGVEEKQAEINKLRENLAKLQEAREQTKEELAKLVKSIGDVNVSDAQFFSKIGNFLRGYSNFHAFCIGTIAYSRHRIIELSLDQTSATQLKGIILGLVQAGFPDKLKKDISVIWECDDLAQLADQIRHFTHGFKEDLRFSFEAVTGEVDLLVKGLKEIAIEEYSINLELSRLTA